MSKKLKSFFIGDLEIKIPIIQGGMGVQVSTASLASAVAICGAAGTIASVALGAGIENSGSNYLQASKDGLRNEIRAVKQVTDGVIGVNILWALSNYGDLARVSVEEKADFIVTGAGLPLSLPEFVIGSTTKIIPIVSSGRAADIIIKTWKRRYDYIPDAIVVEGGLAGGHLGFGFDELKEHQAVKLEDLVVEVLKVADEYAKRYNKKIPVIAAGGIFNGEDIARFIRLGASGVQMATRFVATIECSVAESFKKLYVEATEDSVMLIDSPVGMPGRVIRTKFIDKILTEKRVPVRCGYRCLKTCNPADTPYCIIKALFNAAKGDLDNAVVFAGSNVTRVKKIVPVKELIDELVSEAESSLNQT